jgi:hypothetical protein
MFYEVAITPSVFQTATYGSRELCESELRGIWSDLFRSLIVRDLRSGDWYKELWRNKTACPNLGQKALKALKVEKRLLLASSELNTVPCDAPGWCSEALASHRKESLSGIHLGNGLKINNDPKSFSTWTSLPRNTSDNVERQSDPDANPAHHRFKIVGP